ncbi:type II toxin-antitoxin system RelE/ParE family toxin, partial [Vibrio vulnificus]|nr:type II toxin-antitoxin system RelE/ParE family toxin [Vibrio vulnificus]
MWNVVTRPFFDEWFLSLDESDQINVRACIQVLLERGPQLSRPYADTVVDSKHSNMKELRVQSNGKPIRAFFAFDPERTGIIWFCRKVFVRCGRDDHRIQLCHERVKA